ncbi:MAG: N-6 DNA methylase [Lentimicrobiaceae bacterium]|jgi:type I restriction enzyme M protein|nr:N-6 DNA methylase [Lentimicrobiaceae bacterium]
MTELKEGYIRDYISGQQVKATPEEVEAVQVFSKILVEDYGYPKENIQTRPQFRVKASPSDTKGYPVDIVVFSNVEKNDKDAYIIIECKKKTRKDGLDQLKDYLKFSNAYIGVWFNGSETLFLRKIEEEGKVVFSEDIPNIPNYTQRLQDIGLFKRKDLKPTHNLKSRFISIRNYLAGNAVGITRDEELARQIINLILCKLYDEKFTKPEDKVQFRSGIEENAKDVANRIKARFEETKNVYPDVLSPNDQIELDDKSLAYVVGELQNYSLMEAERDVVGDAFEVFIHRALKGGQGQFFTPKNVVKAAINILDVDVTEKVIDPACGSGGFLIEALKYQFRKIEDRGKEYNWPHHEIESEKNSKASLNIRGIERDSFLSKVVKAYMVIMGDGKSGIFCEDSLEPPANWDTKTQSSIHFGSFDILLANPPFGANIPVVGESKLSQFPLGHKWTKGKDGRWVKGKVKTSEAPQILFIDRFLDLLRDGGKMAIVLPDGVLSNPTDEYIIQSLLERAEIIGLIDLPMSTFLPYTPTKTHLLLLKKTANPRKDYTFFMSYAKTCGHDKRGREVNEDEIALIPEYLRSLDNGGNPSHLGFKMKYSELINNILLPKYYNPDLNYELSKFIESKKYTVKSIQELVNEKLIAVTRGNEIGSENYGTGDIPFVRTSEISNWEIVSDSTHCVSEDIYEDYKDKQKIEEEDILVVNDGTYLMGRTAMVTDIDLKIVIQSHFRHIKILNKKKLSPYLLLAMLGLEIVQKQIEAKSFRQGTISTLGNRLLEVKVPIPIDIKEQERIINEIKTIIKNKRDAKFHAQNYNILGKQENLMGIKNKATLGNL